MTFHACVFLLCFFFSFFLSREIRVFKSEMGELTIKGNSTTKRENKRENPETERNGETYLPQSVRKLSPEAWKRGEMDDIVYRIKAPLYSCHYTIEGYWEEYWEY